jgi:hypothetical protein
MTSPVLAWAGWLTPINIAEKIVMNNTNPKSIEPDTSNYPRKNESSSWVFRHDTVPIVKTRMTVVFRLA